MHRPQGERQGAPGGMVIGEAGETVAGFVCVRSGQKSQGGTACACGEAMQIERRRLISEAPCVSMPVPSSARRLGVGRPLCHTRNRGGRSGALSLGCGCAKSGFPKKLPYVVLGTRRGRRLRGAGPLSMGL